MGAKNTENTDISGLLVCGCVLGGKRGVVCSACFVGGDEEGMGWAWRPCLGRFCGHLDAGLKDGDGEVRMRAAT